MRTCCQYFTRYGNGGVAGACGQWATLALQHSDVRPMIRVCYEHAVRITERFPSLGGVVDRFVKVTAIGDDQ